MIANSGVYCDYTNFNKINSLNQLTEFFIANVCVIILIVCYWKYNTYIITYCMEPNN